MPSSPIERRKSTGMDAGEELRCPVCVEPFTHPVGLPCGHRFCQSCIRVVWNMEGPEACKGGPLFCPECRILLPSDLKLENNPGLQMKAQEHLLPPSPVMASSPIMCDHCIEKTEVAVKSCLTCDASLCSAHSLQHQRREVFRWHTLVEVTEDLISFKCKEHGEELKLFCREDRAAVCCLCIVVGSHKNHQAVKLQEACSEYKEVLKSRESILRQRRRLAEQAVKDLELLFSEVSKNAEECKLDVMEKYRRMKTQIEEDEKLMLTVLETEEFYTNKWLKWRSESLQSCIRDINTVLKSSQSLIQEENDILFLQHLKKHGFGSKVDLPHVPVIQQEFKTPDKMDTVKQLVNNLHEDVIRNTKRLWSSYTKISLDPQTAHPELKVSADSLEVHWCKKSIQDTKLTSHITSQYSVRTKERFSSGSHYWEVAVWKKPYWLIGLSYGSAPGEDALEHCSPCCSNVFCYIYHGNGIYLVCQDSKEKALTIGKTVQKLGVWVDMEKGAVMFYDADTLTLLHSFSVEFLDTVYPIFNPCLDLNGQNNQPLTIVHLKNKHISQSPGPNVQSN